MSAKIYSFHNPMHEALVKQERIARGLPVMFAVHPFAGLPCWGRTLDHMQREKAA